MNETFHRLGTDNLSNNNFHRLLFEENEDIDIYREIDIQSSYYSPDKFCEKFKNSKNISILSLNIQSINSKFSSLSDLIHFWKEKGVIFDIICLQECYSIVIPTIFEISLYHPIVFKTRTTFVGGGVAFYINKSLNFSVLNEYSIFHEKIIESLFIELEFNNKKKLVIGNFYRSPSTGVNDLTPNMQIELFLEHLQGILDSINERKCKAILCGDFNLDLLSYNVHNYTADFVSMLFSAGFLQLISNPTRVSAHNNTATLIDHIWTNDIKDQMVAGIITTYMSDHFSTFHFISTNKHKPSPKVISTRVFSDVNIESFKDDLSNLSFNEVFEKNNPTESYAIFQNLFQSSFEKNFPVKEIRFNKNYHFIQKWMTKGILRSRNKKFDLQSRLAKDPTTENKELYTKYKNVYNKVLKTAKKLYYSNLLVSNQNDLKKSWQIIKDAAGLNSKRKFTTDKIIVEGNDILGEKNIGEAFNRHFSSIALNIRQTIPPTDRPPDSYLEESGYLFNIPPITQANITEIVNNFEIKKSCDNLGISSFLLKKVVNYILDPLCHIFNKSIELGSVPDQFKIAKVTAVFKKGGDPFNLNDYRPISLLLIFSKILEKFIAINLQAYLSENNLIDELQFGFQPNNSTFHPMIHLLNHISKAMNNKEYTIGIFCDIRKAFDCVPINTLLMKLRKFGIHGNMLNWFESYLTGRNQFVKFGLFDSDPVEIDSGVPQGSILGPILFLIFFNDLPKTTLLKVLLFCDDTTILASGKNLNELVEFVNAELKNISQWFRANQMSLHPNKTKFTIFYPTPSLIPWNEINLYFDDNEPNTLNPNPLLRHRIDFVNHESDIPAIKFLGIFLDPALNFKVHINELNKKLSKSLFCLRKCQSLLTEKALKALYFSIFHCHLVYGILIYSCASPSNLTSIITKQKMAVRCIKQATYYSHSRPLFKDLNILPFESLSRYFKLKFMYEYLNNLLPRSFNNMWPRRGELNGNYNLRNNNNLTVPFSRINLVERLPLCSLPSTWNSFNDRDNIKNAINLNQFKKQLKKCILSRIDITCNRLLCRSCHLRM
jgi:exonuclease III